METVVLLGRELGRSREHVYLDYEPSKEIDLPGGATYEQIKAYVLEHTGLKVSHLYIAQVKQKHGIIERECYNKPKSEDAKQPQCPPEKEAAIEAALKHFKAEPPTGSVKSAAPSRGVGCKPSNTKVGRLLESMPTRTDAQRKRRLWYRRCDILASYDSKTRHRVKSVPGLF